MNAPDGSLRYDRSVKAPLYARHGIPEYWLVRLDAQAIEVYRSPAEGGYATLKEIGPGEMLDIEALPGTAIAAASVLG